MKHFIAALVAELTLVGCASVPMADSQLDAALKTFSIDANKAGVFIYRSEIIAAAVKMDVGIDGVHLGQTGAKTYLYKSVEPGKHTITSRTENTDTLEVDVMAGSLAYVWQQVTMGNLAPRSKLHLVNEALGQSGVLASRLAASHALMQSIEVRVAADDPAWGGPLPCQAANSLGRWPFIAPGTVTVEPSASPLQITCQAPIGVEVETARAPGLLQPPRDSARQGAATGAKVGAGVGVALGVAAAPVMGPAFAVLLGLGSAFKGAEIGGFVSAVTVGDRMTYPNPMVVQIKRKPSPN